jgi:hypothetical protein
VTQANVTDGDAALDAVVAAHQSASVASDPALGVARGRTGDEDAWGRSVTARPVALCRLAVADPTHARITNVASDALPPTRPHDSRLIAGGRPVAAKEW